MKKVLDNRVDIILSHTCPYKYLPREMFLDEIEESTDYNLWYCGYYYTDKEIDKIIFMFHKIEAFK